MDRADWFRLFYLVITPGAMLALGGIVYWIATRRAHR